MEKALGFLTSKILEINAIKYDFYDFLNLHTNTCNTYDSVKMLYENDLPEKLYYIHENKEIYFKPLKQEIETAFKLFEKENPRCVEVNEIVIGKPSIDILNMYEFDLLSLWYAFYSDRKNNEDSVFCKLKNVLSKEDRKKLLHEGLQKFNNIMRYINKIQDKFIVNTTLNTKEN